MEERMRKIWILLILGMILSSCSRTPKEKTITVDEMKVPYSIVEQSIELDDFMSLELFLNNGFDPNYVNKDGETLLMYTVKNNSLKSLEVLTKKGVNLEIETALTEKENTTGYLPVKRAIDYVKSKRALEILVDSGANIDYKDNMGDPLIIKFIKEKPESYVKYLIENGANLNVQDKYGWTPLIWATTLKKKELVQLMLKKGADINRVDKRGNPAIYYAYGEDMILTLLNKDINLKLKNRDGENVLGEVYLRSISNSYYKAVEKLIKLGVDRNYSSYGDTPLKIAIENNDKKMLDLLRKYNVKK
jgi:ankyrin repeat protein